MAPINRRTFLHRSLLTSGAALATGIDTSLGQAADSPVSGPVNDNQQSTDFNATVDFRFSPRDFQSTICFPDDPAKTVVGKWGDLRYDFPSIEGNCPAYGQFGTIVKFSLAGAQEDSWLEQTMEAPGIPILHTIVNRPAAIMELVAFASRRQQEGRVDNVLLEIRARDRDVAAAPLVRIRSCQSYRVGSKSGIVTEVLRGPEDSPWMVAIPLENQTNDSQWFLEEGGFGLMLQHGTATRSRPLRYLFRFPQPGAAIEADASVDPDQLLAEIRSWWRQWQPSQGKVRWSLPSEGGEFLISSARNIQQAREKKEERLVFQVGPTIYRGLWMVDGNFLLEAARYLGFDEDADKGLLAEWKLQVPSGQIIASAGHEHWKDTAIPIFTAVRACELRQDWDLVRRLAPNIGHAIEFLIGLRNEARKSGTPNGSYGLLAPGVPDGGVGGTPNEFTNTLWTLAALRAVARANEHLQLPDLDRAASFYTELRSAFDAAAQAQMVHDERGFNYLPMVLREDPQMQLDAWSRPRPQSSQWALSQAIFPGQVFTKNDPIVNGHIALMQACTQEDVPAETGWQRHDGVWNYNAAFVAEVYLWAGLPAWAHHTFVGFLNHASPLRAWREEQPLQHALLGSDWGDMPHNWASAECIRYLRHMLVLEDDRKLRLLAGLMPVDLRLRQPFSLLASPTRFGRVSLTVEPEGARGWKVHFTREQSSEPPEAVEIPGRIDVGASLSRVEGAAKRGSEPRTVSIDPAVLSWTAYWES